MLSKKASSTILHYSEPSRNLKEGIISPFALLRTFKEGIINSSALFRASAYFCRRHHLLFCLIPSKWVLLKKGPSTLLPFSGQMRTFKVLCLYPDKCVILKKVSSTLLPCSKCVLLKKGDLRKNIHLKMESYCYSNSRCAVFDASSQRLCQMVIIPRLVINSSPSGKRVRVRVFLRSRN